MLRVGISAAIASAFPVQPNFWAPLKTSLVLSRGVGSPTFTRATTATVFDNEDVLRTALASEARFTGARRVRNLLPASEDFTSMAVYGTPTSVTTDVVDFPSGATKSTVVTTDAAYEGIDFTALTVGRIYTASVAAKGTGDFVFSDATQDLLTKSATATWSRYSVTFTATMTRCALLVKTAGATIRFSKWLIEDVTGQSNQAPADYVSVGVLPAPYHGANVDGVKYFPWLNGNTVASNIVTEAQGTPIPDATLQGFLSEGERTQYLGVTAAPATQTTASLGTGTYCLWCVGGTSVTSSAGTATLTGAGAAVPGTPNVFTVTVAGTVTVTVSGAVTFFQLENGAFPSQRIDNTGAAGTSVTRNADLDSLPTAGNILAAQGTLYMEITPQHAPSGTVFFWGTYVDASNYTALLHDGTNLIFRKRIAGVNYDATIAWAFVSGTTAKVAASWGASGTSVYLNGTAGTPHANTTAAQIASTMQLGADGNGANQPFAAIKNDRIWLRQLPDATLQAITK